MNECLKATAAAVEELQRLTADEAKGGEGVPVHQAAKRLGISASADNGELRKLAEETTADDLEE